MTSHPTFFIILIFAALITLSVFMVLIPQMVFGEPYYSQEIYVVDVRNGGYKPVMLHIIDDEWDALEEDKGRVCMGSWLGCAIYGQNPRIYALENNGCIIWHEIQHHMGIYHGDPRMLHGCGTWIGKGERLVG